MQASEELKDIGGGSVILVFAEAPAPTQVVEPWGGVVRTAAPVK